MMVNFPSCTFYFRAAAKESKWIPKPLFIDGNINMYSVVFAV